jgi:hypothetical protein
MTGYRNQASVPCSSYRGHRVRCDGCRGGRNQDVAVAMAETRATRGLPHRGAHAQDPLGAPGGPRLLPPGGHRVRSQHQETQCRRHGSTCLGPLRTQGLAWGLHGRSGEGGSRPQLEGITSGLGELLVGAVFVPRFRLVLWRGSSTSPLSVISTPLCPPHSQFRVAPWYSWFGAQNRWRDRGRALPSLGTGSPSWARSEGRRWTSSVGY